MPGKILITGGAGFIGSHVTDRLIGMGRAVDVLDNLDPFYDINVKLGNIKKHLDNPGYKFIQDDLRNYESILEKLKGPYSAIIHLAARAGVRSSIQNPRLYQDVNVAGTQNILEVARELQVGKFIFASSSSVYGANNELPWSEDDCVLLPVSPYASTKVSGELLGHVYSHLYDMQFIALRFFTVYGPRQRPDLAIHKFAGLILKGEPLPLYGDGHSFRDYTYVDDIVDGILCALEYNDKKFNIFNLGNDHTISLLEMIGVLEDALGVKARLEFLPPVKGDLPKTWANIRKAGEVLGYKPHTDFLEGIAKFAQWFRETNKY